MNTLITTFLPAGSLSSSLLHEKGIIRIIKPKNKYFDRRMLLLLVESQKCTIKLTGANIIEKNRIKKSAFRR
jgi:hypothetical protein